MRWVGVLGLAVGTLALLALLWQSFDVYFRLSGEAVADGPGGDVVWSLRAIFGTR